MRRALVLCLLVVLLAPAAAIATGLASGDGMLAVRNGDGVVGLKLKSGAILGRIQSGRLEIVVDPDVNCDELLVWDYDRDSLRPLASRDKVACVFVVGRESPADMRFRLVREENEIRLTGRGLWISAVGRGQVYLKGSTRERADGVYSLNGARERSLPDRGESFQLRSPLP